MIISWLFAALTLALFIRIALLVYSAFNWRLWPAIRRARRGVREVALQRCTDSRVLVRHGHTASSAHNVTFFIATNTETDAQKLREDKTFYPALKSALLAAGYPVDAAQYVHFPVDSQERVDRDHNGDWNEAMEKP